ncbi:MAG: hypothetical protein GF355_07260 [Candidatus Eisenbacteria bacterium]|nr:hypothetical protein [Candidatus Eisenbacteria bacterium]
MNPGDEQQLDSRLQAYLDGELDPADARAFEERMTQDPRLARQLRLMRRMDDWLERDIAGAPDLSGRIQSQLEGARSAAPAARRRRPVWIGALAAAAAAAVLLVWWLPRDEAVVQPAEEALQAKVEELAPETAHEFSLTAPGAEEVCLVGSFNRWEVCATPLEPAGDGRWRVSLELPPGRHEYMFVVDSRWRTDPNAPVHVDDGFGNRNAVIIL